MPDSPEQREHDRLVRGGRYSPLLEEVEGLRARVAELEAERDRARRDNCAARGFLTQILHALPQHLREEAEERLGVENWKVYTVGGPDAD